MLLTSLKDRISLAYSTRGSDSLFLARPLWSFSRTHKQIQQVVKELKKNTNFNPRMTVLGSRDQYCINADVKKKFDKTEPWCVFFFLRRPNSQLCTLGKKEMWWIFRKETLERSFHVWKGRSSVCLGHWRFRSWRWTSERMPLFCRKVACSWRGYHICAVPVSSRPL